MVSLPGKPDPATIALVERSAKLQFRAVIAAQQTAVPQPTGTPTGTPTGSPTGSKAATPRAEQHRQGPRSQGVADRVRTGHEHPAGTPRRADALAHRAGRVGACCERHGGTGGVRQCRAQRRGHPHAKPTDASDPNWVTPALAQQFTALDCSDPATIQKLRAQSPPPSLPFITCADDGTEKYLLGPRSSRAPT